MARVNSYEYYEANQSLLNMLNKKSGDSLISQIVTDNQTAYDKKMEELGVTSSSSDNSKYTAVEKASTNLISAISTLKEDGLYEAEDGEEYDSSSLLKAVSNFATAYNTEITNLTSCGGALYNNFYSELDDDIEENAEAFSSIGISLSSDGKIVIDQDKLSSASVDDIKALFDDEQGSMNGLVSSLNSIDEIIDKALSYTSSSLYTSSGSYLNF